MLDALRRSLSLGLAASLILVSPGLSSYSAAATNFEGPAGKGVPEVQLIKTTLPAVELPKTLVPSVGVEGIPGTELGIPSVPQIQELPGAQAQPGTPQAEAQGLSNLSESLAPQIQAAGSADNADPRGSGDKIETLIEGALSESRRTGSDVLAPAELPNPAGFYAHAYPIAVQKAAELGKKPSQVHFYEAAASVPGVDGASWKFSFYITDSEKTPEQLAKDKPKVGDIVYVDFKKAGLGSVVTTKISDDPHLDSYLDVYAAGLKVPKSYAPAYEVERVQVFKNAPLSPEWVPFTADQTYFNMGSRTSAQAALEAGRRQGLSGGVSVSFRMREKPVSGDKDYWYSFHDGKGVDYRANGRDNSFSIEWKGPVESSSARLARYTGRGQAVGLGLGIISAAAIYHGVTHMDDGSDLAFKLYMLSMLVTPLAMLLTGVGLTKLGGIVGAWASGVKAPKAAPAPQAVVVEAPKPVVVEAPKPVVEAPKAPAAPRTYEAEGREAGEWVGGISFVASAAATYFVSNAIVSALGVSAIFATSLALPLLGFALVFGGSRVGAAIGRRLDRNGGKLNLGVFEGGLVRGAATYLLAGLMAAVGSAGFTTLLALMAGAQLLVGLIGAGALLATGGRAALSTPGAKNFLKMLVSGAVSGLPLAALVGYLSFSVAGTIKDKAGAPVKPLEHGVRAVYAEAFAAAMDAAQKKGYKPGELAFAGLEAYAPADGSRGWTAQFVARHDAASPKGELFQAFLYPQKEGGLKAGTAYSYGEVAIPQGSQIADVARTIARGAKADLASALKDAAEALGAPAEKLGLSVEAKDKGIWYVFDNEDGKRWAVNGATGKGRAWTSSTVTRARLDAAVKSAASYKGMPWSQTEFNMTESMTADSLRKDGATLAQLRLYHELLDKEPVKGGRFNPWSGD